MTNPAPGHTDLMISPKAIDTFMANNPFSTNLPRFQTAWDSTSLGWLKTCPRLYEYQMLEGWEPRSKGLHLYFGGLYASGVERYAHARASGLSHDASTIKMVRWVLENSGTRTWDEDQCTETPVGPGTWHPWEDPLHRDWNIKNRFTLIRSLVWNVEERQSSPFSTHILANGRPAVELSFNFPFTEIEGEPISLSGHLDEVVLAEGDLYVRDDKTTKSSLDANYAAQYTPNNQMSLYSVAGGIILERPVKGVLVKAAQIGVNFTRFKTFQVPRPKAVLSEWLADTKSWIELAHRYAVTNHYPLNDKSCFLCSFKAICAVSPSHREAHLKADFVRRSWNPLASRGDV